MQVNGGRWEEVLGDFKAGFRFILAFIHLKGDFPRSGQCGAAPRAGRAGQSVSGGIFRLRLGQARTKESSVTPYVGIAAPQSGIQVLCRVGGGGRRVWNVTRNLQHRGGSSQRWTADSVN